MPVGSLWPPSGNRSNNGNNNGPFNPFRRRRSSMMGRKIRSDNDLPNSAPQQHLQEQQPSSSASFSQIPINNATLLQLPDNVRTILIAGTPECWNLSTSAESFVPEVSSCDGSSLQTYGSELTPGSLTIDEEESYHGSPHRRRNNHSERSNDNLDWLRRPSPSTKCGNNMKRKTSKQQPNLAARRRDQLSPSPLKEPSSMVVMYKSPAHHPSSPHEAIHIWLNSVEGLMRSKEMANLVTSTKDVVSVAGGIVVKTAFLPVTFPFHVACATKDFVGWSVHQALSHTTGAILQLTNGDEKQMRDSPTKQSSESRPEKLAEEKPAEETRSVDEKEQSDKNDGNPLEGLLQLVPAVLDGIGSAVIGLVTPPQPKKEVSSTKQNLDRLKIPVVGAEEISAPAPAPAVVVSVASPRSDRATKADYSKYLLRVDDLGVHVPIDGVKVLVLYIDLNADFRDEPLMKSCLKKMSDQAVALATTSAPGIPPATVLDDAQVEWKPEGATAKLLRKKKLQSVQRWDETIRSEVLIWSGNFKKGYGGSSIHRQYPMFLARGVVERLSPRQFLELLWNNDRTCEYNNFCMGRKDAIKISDDILSSPDVHTGVKVVRSETRVPFTGLSVSLCTIMYCHALPGGPQEGYVIISRSLVSGQGGTHTAGTQSSSSIQKPKSEILWGVNFLRAVPGHPDQTELTSVSQVASTAVPQFLSQRIGIMGVEDFFKNVRKGPKVTSAPSSPSASSATKTSSNVPLSCVSV